MTKKKIDKFMLDLIRVCAKHQLIINPVDIKSRMVVQKITAKAVQNIKDAKVDIDGYIEEEEEQKNPKKKYKFYKPKEKEENN